MTYVVNFILLLFIFMVKYSDEREMCYNTTASALFFQNFNYEPIIQEIYICPNTAKANNNRLDALESGSIDRSTANTFVDSQNGMMNVYFSDQMNSTFAEIFLYVGEQLDSKKCNKESINYSNFKQHSRLFFYLKWCSSPENCPSPCSENISATFDYVYSGCYYIKISRCKNFDSLTDIVTTPELVKTSYNKELIVKPVIRTDAECHMNSENGFIKFRITDTTIKNNLKTVAKSRLKIMAMPSDHEDPVIALCHLIGRQLNCESIDNSIGVTCSLKQQTQSLIGDNQIKEVIDCEIKNATERTYYIQYHYIDTRCSISTVWTPLDVVIGCDLRKTICSFVEQRNDKKEESKMQDCRKDVPEMQHGYIKLSACYILCLVIAILLICVILIYLKKDSIFFLDLWSKIKNYYYFRKLEW